MTPDLEELLAANVILSAAAITLLCKTGAIDPDELAKEIEVWPFRTQTGILPRAKAAAVQAAKNMPRPNP